MLGSLLKSLAIAANGKLLPLAAIIGPLVIVFAFDAGHGTLDSAVGANLRTADAGPALPTHQPRKFVNSSPNRSRKGRSTSSRRKRSYRTKVIIWATDGSSVADNALPYATSVARAEGAQLIAVHIDEFVVGRGGGHSVKIDEPQIQAAILRKVEDLKRDGLDASLCVSRTWVGGAARAIANIAIDVNADMIIAGTPGHGLLLGLLTSSVTRKLTRMVHCPVLAVPKRSPRSFLW
jgi:nucleotide-binding universal stress UspA family protein